jgi:hypothetical protein
MEGQMKRANARMVLVTLAVLLPLAMLSCSAADSIPNPFASPTATVTATATSTRTPTRTPRPTATRTPTATPLPTNYHLEKRWDGTRLIDEDGGYSLVLPSRWVAREMREIDSANSATQAIPPDVGFGPNTSARIVAVDNELAHRGDEIVAHLFVMLTLADLPKQPEFLDGFADLSIALARSENPDLKVTHETNSRTNVNGITIASVGVDMPVKLSDGSQGFMSKRLSFFQTDSATVVISFTSAQAEAAEMWRKAQNILDTIELLPSGE